jgi:phytoene desaturase
MSNRASAVRHPKGSVSEQTAHARDSVAPASGDGPRRPHAVVIGSGFGGLAAAIRLGARGYRVTVLEKQASPGGRGIVRERDGFVFDSGPTVVTAPFMFEDLWKLAGRDIKDDIDLRPVTPFYRIRFHDGTNFEYTGDADDMRNEVRKLNPEDVAGYDKFVEHSEKIFKVGFEELAHVPFGSWLDMAKIAPAMVKLQSFRSVYSLVASYIKDERLRQVMSFHPLLVGGNPFATTSIYTLIAFLERKWGVHYPMGGTGSLVNGLCKLIGSQGGNIRYNVEVEKILSEGRTAVGVRLKGGEEIAAEIVVSNQDSATTYRNLVDETVRKRWTNQKIENSRYSMGLFVWYFGTKKRYEDVAHHTIMLGPRYRGLLDDIFEGKKVCEDASLYLHRPTATDPNMAPAGCDTFYVLSPVPHLDSGTDWAAFGGTYRQRVSKMLSDTLLPDLESNLVVSEFITPQFFQDTLNSYKGAAFGIEPVLTQSAYFRPHNKSEELRNLFLVGAGTHPGAGMPGVLSSAKVLDTIVPDASTWTELRASTAR